MDWTLWNHPVLSRCPQVRAFVSLVGSLLASAAAQRDNPADVRRLNQPFSSALSAEMVRCMRDLGVVKVSRLAATGALA
jgi:hypothetical protein